MAQAKIKRKQQVTSQRTEFFVPEARILAELLDPDQTQIGDVWEFVGQGPGNGLVMVRIRSSVKVYDIDGNDVA